MIRAAIIDPGCRLSALPTPSELEGHEFITNGCAVIMCEIEEALVSEVWRHRDMAYVLPLGVPAPADLPEGVYILSLDLSVDPPIMSIV